MTQIIIEVPPMFDQIDARFHVKGKTVIFSWGDKIYNPTGAEIPPQLIAHEVVHGHRQGENIERWWERYIEDSRFRFMEELIAHRVEYRWLLSQGVNRRTKRAALTRTAHRLAAPLYGSMVSVAKAKKLLEMEQME
ncbi:hypothetical protein LCGC14_0886650 [marine sediment metagenome]|uniref:DUF4157 domain-containing protein n=1 Tax=marine sediment metagenome TaxID=412755 RepID=A0A0F9S7E4_9ZZZZ